MSSAKVEDDSDEALAKDLASLTLSVLDDGGECLEAHSAMSPPLPIPDPRTAHLTGTTVGLNHADPAFFALGKPSSSDSFPISLASDFSSAEDIGELAPKTVEAAHRRSRRISEVLDAKEVSSEE